MAGAANFIKPKEESRLQAESIRAHKDSNSTSKQHKSDAIDSIKDLNLNISSVHNDVNNMNANMSSNFTSLKKDVQDMNTNITSLKKDVRDLHVDMKSQIKSSEKNLKVILYKLHFVSVFLLLNIDRIEISILKILLFKDFIVKQDKIIFDQLSTLKVSYNEF